MAVAAVPGLHLRYRSTGSGSTRPPTPPTSIWAAYVVDSQKLPYERGLLI